jgi:hypothetical protein
MMMEMRTFYEGEGALRMLFKRRSILTKGSCKCRLRGDGQAQGYYCTDDCVSYFHVESFHTLCCATFIPAKGQRLTASRAIAVSLFVAIWSEKVH